MVAEITIVVKGENSSYREKHLVYDPIQLNPPCNNIENLIIMEKSAYKGDIDSIQIKINSEIQ